MKRLLLLLVLGTTAALGQAVVDGFTLDQVSFTAEFSGNVPCSEYGQASFAVRQFPGVVQYVQVVAQLAGSTTPPAWIVKNVPLAAGVLTEGADVNLALLGIQRSTCITGAMLNYALTVTDNRL